MEYPPEQKCYFSDVVETLLSMFGNVISKEVIETVVESCDGDLNVAAEALMNISCDTATQDSTQVVDNTSETKTSPECTDSKNIPIKSTSNCQQKLQSTEKPTMSYSGASRATGAVPKQTIKPCPPPSNAVVWTDQLRHIINLLDQGFRVLILMRGVPGSGKSFLAKQLVEMAVGVPYSDTHTHIFSTDDYFMVRGQYCHDKSKLSYAHDWNQNRVRAAVSQGLSPIIIDNTNVEIWEMEPYVRYGVKHGYILEVVEPNTPWARKANQLIKRNTHNVPYATIRRMLDNYQNGITGEFLKKYYGLSYPADLVPPVLRLVPPLKVVYQVPQLPTAEIEQTSIPEISNQINNELQNMVIENEHNQYDDHNIAQGEGSSNIVESDDEAKAKQQRYLEIQKQLEEMEKVEQEWENGESWNEDSQNSPTTNIEKLIAYEPRDQRRTNSEGSTPRDNLLENVQNCDDWRKISMFMPPWTDDASVPVSEPIEIPVKTTVSSGTCVESGDADLINPKRVLKILPTTSRDINQFRIDFVNKKIPLKPSLDKSTMTNELLLTETHRCKNEEQHFLAFRKMFKNIPRAALRDIFDKCCGDVNWAVDIVLGGVADNQLEIGDGIEDSDIEDEKEDECSCLAAYNVVPDTEPALVLNTATSDTASVLNIPLPPEPINATPRKAKVAPTDSSLQLKRDIERNFFISDEHYPKNVLKIKKFRNGEYLDENSELNVYIPVPGDYLENQSPEPQPSTSKEVVMERLLLNNIEGGKSDEDDSVTSSLDDAERTINVNVGAEFISQLDELFGRRGMTYPENIVPRINIPVSLLNEINAFWMESLMCQLDEQDKQKTRMLKEDTDFARQLAMKEEELARQGKEPEVPDFKEIMDMDFAISLYQKDVAEWRSKEPVDLAAKMSRDKLYNLFPDMSQEVLSELLMAHDNNFQATVEVLLMSTGNAEILQQKNGVSKFVMAKELERQERVLQEEKKALSEVEWPLLPVGENVDLAVVNGYREEADKHLSRRNLNYQKAQEYIRRGMTQVANYYSDIASFHKQKYEQANSLAAASLMQLHASNNTDNSTIDLHYLRVGEAKEALDLFIDTHIHKLRESTNKSVRYHTLFFITGRGLHSNGRPRVKPAVKKRLNERGIIFSERNPGLLTAKVSAEDKLSYQVKVP